MRCKCCNKRLTELEAKVRDPHYRTEFLDLCGVCLHYSNPYLEDEEALSRIDSEYDSRMLGDPLGHWKLINTYT